MIQSYSEDSTMAFTDGSCMGNPGPCGTGACISLLGVEEHVCLKKPECKCGSVLFGEMVDMQMVLQFISHRPTNTESQMCKEVNIFSDSQSAMVMLTLDGK